MGLISLNFVQFRFDYVLCFNRDNKDICHKARINLFVIFDAAGMNLWSLILNTQSESTIISFLNLKI